MGSANVGLLDSRDPSTERVTREQEKGVFPYCFYFVPFHDYTDSILESLFEILLFEYLIAMGAYYLKQGRGHFWHSYATIQKDTRITPNTARQIVKKFVEIGLVTTEVKYINRSRTTCFTVQYLEIARKAGIIWGSSTTSHSPARIARVKIRKQILIQMFKLTSKLKKR